MTRFGRSAGLPAAARCVSPSPLEREPAEHRRLARAGRRAAGRLGGAGRVPEAREDVHAAHLDLRGRRVLVLVDHVLVEALGHQLLGLRLHPGRDEGGHVEPRVAVEHQLVVDHLVGHVGRQLAWRELVARDRGRVEREERRHGDVARLGRGALRVLERHGALLSLGVTCVSLTLRRLPPGLRFVDWPRGGRARDRGPGARPGIQERAARGRRDRPGRRRRARSTGSSARTAPGSRPRC